ncbi:hypothetical protein B484DRAFT_467153, partial [Ochromonadaceae sp. CCMP2298]
MYSRIFFTLILLSAWCATSTIDLGDASSYAILAGSAVTTSGAIDSVVTGNVGVYPGTSITGFPPGGTAIVYGDLDIANTAAFDAQAALTSAYDTAAGLAADAVLSDLDLAGMTLLTGVYKFAAEAALNGVLTLDANGDPDAAWTFQIGSAILYAAGSEVVFKDGVGNAENVYWQVGSSVTLSAGAKVVGSIIAYTAITAETGVTVQGRLLARGAAVTIVSSVVDSNSATSAPSALPTPQPTSQPSSQPSTQPSSVPSGQPTSLPSTQPSAHPSSQPTGKPSGQPTSCPAQPSGQPSTAAQPNELFAVVGGFECGEALNYGPQAVTASGSADGLHEYFLSTNTAYGSTAHSEWLQIVSDTSSGAENLRIYWTFSTSKTLSDRFEGAVTVGETVNYRIELSGGTVYTYTGATWRFSDNAGSMTSRFSAGSTTCCFSSDDAAWGGASGIVNGNDASTSTFFGQGNLNTGDSDCTNIYQQG